MSATQTLAKFVAETGYEDLPPTLIVECKIATLDAFAAAFVGSSRPWAQRVVEMVHELGGKPSALNFLWYAGSYAIGALAGLTGDRNSLGFIAETERQVVEHLAGHLERLPADDARSRALLERMQDDEARHGQDAERAGGAPLPAPIQELMRATARVMTGTAYWI